MKKAKKTCASVSAGSAMGLARPLEDSLTLANLRVAYSGESAAYDRYLAFAREAGEEGYEPVASLFRAAARSEQIHARNHLEALNGDGGPNPQNTDTTNVQSTRDSLQEAIQGEVYERDEMYPSFLHQARGDGNKQAARSFQLAQKAETQHAALFTQSLQDLERLRGESVVYSVCPVCGFTTANGETTRCPLCSTPAERFEKVS